MEKIIEKDLKGSGPGVSFEVLSRYVFGRSDENRQQPQLG
jgi:hypothetical protein